MRSATVAISVFLLLLTSAAAAEMGTALCKEWERASRTIYQGPGDKTYYFYDEAHKWIIGQVLGSPIPVSSEVGALINSTFSIRQMVVPTWLRQYDALENTSRPATAPTVTMSNFTERITELALKYCEKHPKHSLAAVVDYFIKPRAEKGAKTDGDRELKSGTAPNGLLPWAQIDSRDQAAASKLLEQLPQGSWFEDVATGNMYQKK